MDRLLVPPGGSRRRFRQLAARQRARRAAQIGQDWQAARQEGLAVSADDGERELQPESKQHYVSRWNSAASVL